MNFARPNSYKLLLNIRDTIILKFDSLYISRQRYIRLDILLNFYIQMDHVHLEDTKENKLQKVLMTLI